MPGVACLNGSCLPGMLIIAFIPLRLRKGAIIEHFQKRRKAAFRLKNTAKQGVGSLPLNQLNRK